MKEKDSDTKARAARAAQDALAREAEKNKTKELEFEERRRYDEADKAKTAEINKRKAEAMEELDKSNPEEAKVRKETNEELEEAMSGRATELRIEELNKAANTRLQAIDAKIKHLGKSIEAAETALDKQERKK